MVGMAATVGKGSPVVMAVGLLAMIAWIFLIVLFLITKQVSGGMEAQAAREVMGVPVPMVEMVDQEVKVAMGMAVARGVGYMLDTCAWIRAL